MNEDVKSEFNALLASLRSEKCKLGELSLLIAQKVSSLRSAQINPVDEKIDEFAGYLGLLRMEILHLQKIRIRNEEILKELSIVLG
jgi:hypothetical protein